MNFQNSDNDKSFFLNVYEVVKLIPAGRVTSYGAIAKYLGTPRSARMVGWALNSQLLPEDVPAHRVLNKQGILTGKVYFGQTGEMQNRLENEGIKIENDKVAEMEKVFWDPAKELL